MASDPGAGDGFGFSVAMDGGVAISGARRHDHISQDAGVAYVYRSNGGQWRQEQELLASDGAAADEFGYSVAISGDVAVVGAPKHDALGSNAGAAYVFRFDGSRWAEERKLLASDGAASAAFGTSVSTSGSVIVIGAYGTSTLGSYSGSVYVFRFDGSRWAEEQKVLASDGTTGDFFGYAVSISESAERMVIGAYGNDDNGPSSGAAYVCRLDGSRWVEEQKLLASDGATDDLFGWAVTISGDTVVCGAWKDDDNGLESGSAYVFRLGGSRWNQEAKLVAADGGPNDQFGKALDLSGHVVVVGARLEDDLHPDSGAAYAFRFDGSSWRQDAKLKAPDAWGFDEFGSAVAASGDRILVGAVGEDAGQMNSGSAYVFLSNAQAPPCPADINGDAVVDVLDLLDLLSAWGTSGPADINGDGVVDVLDLLELLSAWGSCPV